MDWIDHLSHWYEHVYLGDSLAYPRFDQRTDRSRKRWSHLSNPNCCFLAFRGRSRRYDDKPVLAGASADYFKRSIVQLLPFCQ